MTLVLFAGETPSGPEAGFSGPNSSDKPANDVSRTRLLSLRASAFILQIDGFGRERSTTEIVASRVRVPVSPYAEAPMFML
jgi:hypothetical protein